MAGSGVAHLREAPDIALRVERLVVEYLVVGRWTFVQKRSRRSPGVVHAVSDVSFDIRRGETLGLVGESGCGKSTAGRSVMMLAPPTSGTVHYEGTDLTALDQRDLRRVRRRIQMVFQDPVSSLNPRRSVGRILGEALRINGDPQPWTEKIDRALLAVGLDPAAVLDRHAHQMSGGQCQRVAIARALLLDPALLVCDEPVSSLDVSVQAQILNLLEDMKAQHDLTMLFIAHDLAVVKNISDRIAVMYLGKLCEIAPAEELYRSPQHPYTQALISSIPMPDPALAASPLRISGDIPSPVDPPSGCRFHTRCPLAETRCRIEEPILSEVEPGHFVACHLAPKPASAPSAAVTAPTRRDSDRTGGASRPGIDL